VVLRTRSASETISARFLAPGAAIIVDSRSTSGTISRIMRGLISYLFLICLAVVVFGISLAIVRILHWPALSYVVIAPIWITVLIVLVMVARVTFNRGRG